MTKPVVVIHVDALRREYPADWLLSKRLEALGYCVILTSRLSSARLLKLFSPDVVILSHVFSIPEPLLASLYRRGVRIYANEVEGEIEGNDLGISGTYPEGIPYHYFEKILTWSAWSSGWLVRNRGVDPARVHAVGSIRLNSLNYLKRTQERCRVGVLSRFEAINTYDYRHPFVNLMDIDLQDNRGVGYLERVLIEMESFAITAKIVEALVSKGIPVSVRPHPNEDVGAYRTLCERYGSLLKIDGGHDFVAWLETISVLVGTLSSAYTEPYLMRIPIVSTAALQRYNYRSEHLSPFVSTFSRAAYQPSSVSGIVELCSNPNLQPIVDTELNRQLAAIYSLSDNEDPIGAVCSLIGKSRATSSKFINGLMAPVKYLIDFAVIVDCLRSRKPASKLRKVRQYDFNAILHKPSAFMNKISQNL